MPPAPPSSVLRVPGSPASVLALLLAVAAAVPAPVSGLQAMSDPPDDTLALEDLEGHWLGPIVLDGREGPRLGLRILRKADGSMGASAAVPSPAMFSVTWATTAGLSPAVYSATPARTTP